MNLGISWEIAAERVVMLGAVLAALAYILRTLWNSYRRLAQFISRVEKVMDNVENQLYPNGGRTLRDAVNRIQIRLGIEDYPPEREL